MLKINRTIRRTTNRQRVMDSFLLYGSNGQPLSIGDISKASGLTRTQVHGAAWTLMREGKLRRVSEGVYQLGTSQPLNTPAPAPATVTVSMPQPEVSASSNGFAVPVVDWPNQEQREAAIQTAADKIQEAVTAPVSEEPSVIGLTAFLAEQFRLDPADVELALRYYDRFIKEGN